MLAANNGPIIIALLQAHILEGERGLPASILFERLGRDLEELRARGEDFPQTAQAYVADWLAAGYLSRRFPAGAAEEEYELTSAAAGAIRLVSSLTQGRTVATESRLATVIQQITSLAAATDTNPETKVASLLAERERLDRQIEEIRHGRIRSLTDERALERVREILALADELAGDFRRVRDEFDGLNRDLRERIMDNDASRGEVLEALFSGVDVIAESEAGRTFQAFWRLLTDPEQSAQLEDSLDQVLARDFAGQLDAKERRFLLRLMPTLLDQGGMVHEVLQYFARSLKQFVQSRDYLEQRRINELLRQAQRTAVTLKEEIRVGSPLNYELQLTSGKLRSLAQWVLYDPLLNAVERGMTDGEAAPIDMESIGELVAQSEIDFRTLKVNIRAALEEQSQVSIGDVMNRFPAAQGLGSVVGYVALGSRHGERMPNRSEKVSWQSEDGQCRAATIPLLIFLREKTHELVLRTIMTTHRLRTMIITKRRRKMRPDFSQATLANFRLKHDGRWCNCCLVLRWMVAGNPSSGRCCCVMKPRSASVCRSCFWTW